ncbi:hypothetical protein A8C56_21825 [Niabella ginsenosidivorans]|uniref:Outer membrane protein beta-barrel domain-containing protein n=1 Tax=Niabella ginsenosidivorans TaxID=1176587 RepID=A0A1A9I6E3_9BACT|nr:outer membrane beta-barrel protein [Niabella ginsenosidivorans]ANH83267.1 hypothetical protein A8C56_21825 [Niabella ginsenosidivorans]
MSVAGTWTAELSGTYQSVYAGHAIFNIAPRGIVSFALAKEPLKNNATITLSLTDPFNLQQSRAASQYGSVFLDVYSHWDNRRTGGVIDVPVQKGKRNCHSKKPESSERASKKG